MSKNLSLKLQDDIFKETEQDWSNANIFSPICIRSYKP
jgi:hypothetical protein